MVVFLFIRARRSVYRMGASCQQGDCDRCRRQQRSAMQDAAPGFLRLCGKGCEDLSFECLAHKNVIVKGRLQKIRSVRLPNNKLL